MYGLLLFSHLAGLMVWVGAILAVIVMLFMLKGQLGTPEANSLSKRIISVFSRFAHPSAFIVLVSGVIMIIQLNMGSSKPFWLDMMEKAGGTIILLFLIVVGIMGGKLKKRLQAAASGTVSISSYVTSLAISLIAILAVVLIVSLKL
ncbi:hypothetical protein D3P09_09995 [Paenibacillus pinisoli]|uniref:DUF2269 family protein n=1 Tax=Paenibacillus pinisoli TaxID=1276110 RepID=A0A3A6Q165_9BACL|nr:hypothetical protein [Paenibacillus pinisoli]RJX39724.1 hypothetical protein D3P09_09995 [Paenibacillus pinisoli]